MTPPVSIVVGASSGIGESLARRLAAEGGKVALLARRGPEVERIAKEINQQCGATRALGVAHDVTDWSAVDGLWGRVESELGQVDALYYAAGILEPVEGDEFDTAKDKRHFDINTLGSVAWVNAAARRFGPRGAGTIVGISSVAQDRGRIGRPAYNASKAGMDTHLEAVRNRLWRKGVTVTTVRPGFVQTPMTEGVQGMFWVISADRAAELTIAAGRKRKAVTYIPWRWRPMMGVIRSIPSFVFRKLNF
ncbi:MAG: SDR family NAD(P)-dependent oxidoreductase [Planctomycetes bacterium]|nr:SDR family NAD(P)-dependent oxidoreductase [Planctomycetota bacterium]MCB9871284.1 SDR family NAD(P)-dependent oxidoreductase [Planctomycetota bacterium]